LKTISLEYYSFKGEGPTVKAAKEKAATQLRAFISDTQSGPVIVLVDSISVVISRVRDSWQYQLIGM
jgi:hypothetical protein